MRVFLDTNVLVSAFATRGLSADVFRLVLAEHELVVGDIVLHELRRVLADKLGVPDRTIQEAVAVLHEHHVVPTTDEDPGVDVADPSDARVLATAIEGNAEVLVTGDRDLLTLSDQVKAVRILDPRGLWEELRG